MKKWNVHWGMRGLGAVFPNFHPGSIFPRGVMWKAQPLCTLVPSQILETEFWVKEERIALFTLPGKGGHHRLLPQKVTCPNPGKFGDSFYHNGSRVQDCTPLISSGWSNIFLRWGWGWIAVLSTIHGESSRVGYSPWGHRRVRHDLLSHREAAAYRTSQRPNPCPCVGRAESSRTTGPPGESPSPNLDELLCVSRSRARLFVTPWTVACQASLSVGLSRPEYWSGLPLPSPGDLPDPGIEPRSPALQADSGPSEPPRKSC